MKNIFILLMLLGSITILAQNKLFVGVSYGNSSVFRKGDASHYNYKNTEVGIFVFKEYAWKSNPEKRIKKYWFVQPQLYFGDYTFLVDDKTESIFRANVGGGIKLEKEMKKSDFHVNISFSPGYHTGYYHRMNKGIYFIEKLSFGGEFPVTPNSKAFIDIGAMHISNANLYKLNRGLEVFFVEVAYQIPLKKE